MLKLCKYYKGDKDRPKTLKGDAQHFWRLECNYVEYEFCNRADYWQTSGVRMASEFHEAKVVMDRYDNLAIKEMLAYMAVMQWIMRHVRIA